MATSRILLITDSGLPDVAPALRSAGHEMTVLDGVEAALAAPDSAEAEVMVLDLAGSAGQVVWATHTLREQAAYAGLPVMCIVPSDDVEDRIRLLEAGADDVITRPFDARELDARVEALALRYQRSRDRTPVADDGVTIRDRGQRRVIAVFSPKGGVGTTTVAVNVATFLAGQLPGAVAILDLDFQFGQVATHLNLETRESMVEVAADDATLHDPGLLQSALDRHPSGLMVLGAPASPDAAEAVTADHVAAAIRTAGVAFRIVVVDAGSTFDARSRAALTAATDVVVVVTPEFPALKAVHSLRDILDADANVAETAFVLNEAFARELLRLSNIEDALGTKVALTIPYDPFAFLRSVNEGVPIVEGSPRTPAADALRRLGMRLAGLTSITATPERRPRGLAGLFGR